ncbi:hypothetical protein B0H17DRAFT_1142009 [Mycena rosella]|uniref:Uncharacterized protein n=1 Tax=Mycena rosella TaxID=1033263 RepID=A0AAD7G5L8_MYCRO|nr:hypothetical protein B0H17DRAFT_1142009 [Mycena rosella]
MCCSESIFQVAWRNASGCLKIEGKAVERVEKTKYVMDPRESDGGWKSAGRPCSSSWGEARYMPAHIIDVAGLMFHRADAGSCARDVDHRENKAFQLRRIRAHRDWYKGHGVRLPHNSVIRSYYIPAHSLFGSWFVGVTFVESTPVLGYLPSRFSPALALQFMFGHVRDRLPVTTGGVYAFQKIRKMRRLQ